MSDDDDDKEPDSTKKLPAEGAAALTALRNLWSNTGGEKTFFAGDSQGPSGRDTMEEIIGKVGYEGLDTFAEDGEATANTHEAGQRLQSAWKKTLQREGKMTHPGQSVSDLIASSRKDGLPHGPGEKLVEEEE